MQINRACLFVMGILYTDLFVRIILQALFCPTVGRELQWHKYDIFGIL